MHGPDPTGGIVVLPVLFIIGGCLALIVGFTNMLGPLGLLVGIGLITGAIVVSFSAAAFIYWGIPLILFGIGLGLIRLARLVRTLVEAVPRPR